MIPRLLWLIKVKGAVDFKWVNSKGQSSERMSLGHRKSFQARLLPIDVRRRINWAISWCGLVVRSDLANFVSKDWPHWPIELTQCSITYSASCAAVRWNLQMLSYIQTQRSFLKQPYVLKQQYLLCHFCCYNKRMGCNCIWSSTVFNILRISRTRSEINKSGFFSSAVYVPIEKVQCVDVTSRLWTHKGTKEARGLKFKIKLIELKRESELNEVT